MYQKCQVITVWNEFFFLNKGGDYSGRVSYLAIPSTVVSSSLRGHVFDFLSLKRIFSFND